MDTKSRIEILTTLAEFISAHCEGCANNRKNYMRVKTDFLGWHDVFNKTQAEQIKRRCEKEIKARNVLGNNLIGGVV